MNWGKLLGAAIAALLAGIGGVLWVSHVVDNHRGTAVVPTVAAPTMDTNRLHVEILKVDRVAKGVIPGALHPLVVTISVTDPPGNNDRSSWGTDMSQFTLFSPHHVGVDPTVNFAVATCPYWSEQLQPGGTVTEQLCFDVPGGTDGAMQLEFRAGLFSEAVQIPVP